MRTPDSGPMDPPLVLLKLILPGKVNPENLAMVVAGHLRIVQ